jgi:hypothetical protein
MAPPVAGEIDDVRLQRRMRRAQIVDERAPVLALAHEAAQENDVDAAHRQ